MNVTVENLGSCKKLLRVEVDAAAVDAAFEKAASEIHRHAQVPGFRPGKVPRDRVAKLYAKEIEQEAKKRLISTAYTDALKDQKLEVVGYPDVEELQFGRGQALQFAATVETTPEFVLPEYKGLQVKVANTTVTQADQERALQVLREQRAAFNDVDRPAQKGDFLVVNYTGTCEGKPITELSPTAKGLTERKNFWLLLQEGSFLPGFTEQLENVKAGEKRTVTVAFPAEFVEQALSGKTGVFEVEALQVKERILPELNEQLAKDFGAENLEKLREGVLKDLQNELKYKQNASMRNQIIRTLLAGVQCELPESLVAVETRNVVYDLVQENQARGVTKETIDEQKDAIYSYANTNAKERVKTAFLLQRIAEKEKISASKEEITQRIMGLAQQYNIRPEKFIKQLQDRNGVGEVVEQIINAKVLDFLQLHAHVEEVAIGDVPA